MAMIRQRNAPISLLLGDLLPVLFCSDAGGSAGFLFLDWFFFVGGICCRSVFLSFALFFHYAILLF